MTDVNDILSELKETGDKMRRLYALAEAEALRENPYSVIEREIKKLEGVKDVICRNVPDRILACEVLIEGCDFDEREVFKIIAFNKPFGVEAIGDHYGYSELSDGHLVRAAFSHINKRKLSFECSFSVDDFEMLIRDRVILVEQLDQIVNETIKAQFPDVYGIRTSIVRMDD